MPILKGVRAKSISENALLCTAYRQCPDNIVTRFVHDESTRRGCLVLYKEVTTLYSSVEYVTTPCDVTRNIKGELVISKPVVYLKHEHPVLTIER